MVFFSIQKKRRNRQQMVIYLSLDYVTVFCFFLCCQYDGMCHFDNKLKKKKSTTAINDEYEKRPCTGTIYPDHILDL